MLKRVRLLTLSVTVSVLSLGAALATAAETEQRYYESGKRALHTQQYQDAIDYYTSLETLNPSSAYLPQVQLEKAFAYYKLGNFEKSIVPLRRFIAENPDHPNLAYAYYIAGLVLYDKTQKLIPSANTNKEKTLVIQTAQAAIGYFSQLINAYPNSPYAQDAAPKNTQLLENLVLQQQTASIKNRIESGRDGNWLLGQPSHYYTIQMLRAPNLAELESVFNEHQGLEEKAIIYKEESPGGTVFTLLYGVYPNQGDAEQVSLKFPEPLRNYQPWTRQLASIQSEIRKNRLLMATPNTMTTQTLAASELPDVIPPPSDTTKIEAYREDWLRRQNPNYYTVQLVGMREEIGIIEFIDQHHLSGKAAYFLSRHNNKNWFSLLYGSYPNKQVAQRAVKRLRKEIGIKDAWVRPYQDIQNIIREAD